SGRNLGSATLRRRRCLAQLLARQTQNELPRGEVVVGTGVDPEQLRISPELREDLRLDGRRVREDRLEDRAHLEVVRIALVVIDIPAGDRRQIEVPDEDPAAKLQ